MPREASFQADLRIEIAELRQYYPAFKDEDLFLIWFLRAYVTEDLETAAEAVTNGPKDKGIDAALVDDASRSTIVVQVKYRSRTSEKLESRVDVMAFAELARILCNKSDDNFRNLTSAADAAVGHKLTNVRRSIHRHNHRLWLYYVTLGRCSAGLRREAESAVHLAHPTAELEIIDGRRLERLMEDYVGGVAPPPPTLDLTMESGQGISLNGILQRYDARSRIESWVFSMRGDAMADLYEIAGKRVFARNIRGFLGEDTPVNRSMEATLRREPERFFYYNNGITILCDNAERVSSGGKDILRVKNPQVINGQQTTRTLARKADEARKASVIVRVIRVPRDGGDGDEEFDSLVSQIVEGTNWQNEIRASDLVSNDRRQVELERALRKRGYLYLRKRESKGEAIKAVGSKRYILVKKEDLARAVAGCDLDPVEARSGVENLFKDGKYTWIFPTSDPKYYLTRYWLLREVTYCAHGYPERGYAKWLVLGFVWSELGSLLRPQSAQERFIKMMERYDPKLEWPLYQAVQKAFVAALNYWRKDRGRGAKAIDVSTFFRNKRGRHNEFKAFWRGRNNRSRRGFAFAWKKVKAVLSEYSK